MNDHPHCRRCRFDLHGIDIEGDGAKCPECGAELGEHKAVRIGARRRRPRFIGLGAVALLVAVAIGVAAGWSAATGFNWNTIKPAWLLESELDNAIGRNDTSVLAELARRAKGGKLADMRLARLGAKGAEEYTAGTEMSRHWTILVSHAWNGGRLSHESLGVYAQNSVVIEAIAAPSMAPEDLLYCNFWMSYLPASEVPYDVDIHMKLERVVLGDIELEPADEYACLHMLGHALGRGMTSSRAAYQPAQKQFPKGEHDFVVEVSFAIHAAHAESGDPPIASWTRTLTSVVHIIESE